MGSGSIGVASVRQGFGFVGIESDPAYFAIAERRLAAARAELPLFATA
jgi:DNA modification methylase